MSFTVIIIIVCVAVAAALVAVFLVFGRSETNFKFDIGGNGPKASGGSDTSAETTMQGRLVGQAAVSGGVLCGSARQTLVYAAPFLGRVHAASGV
jgi:penicillin-binding protein 2